MRKLLATIRKEILILLNDKVGLLLMYLMPLLLVFIITIVQDSTFKLVSENQVDILIVNDDTGKQGDSLVSLLKKSGAFEVEEKQHLEKQQIEQFLLKENKLLAIHIPADFSSKLETKAAGITGKMLSTFGVSEKAVPQTTGKPTRLILYYDPVLQDNYRLSMGYSIQAYMSVIENKLMIAQLYRGMGYDSVPPEMLGQLTGNQTTIIQHPASGSHSGKIPSSTQHNVPAWSIFAMFFMVVSLGGNIVKERLSGTFVRLQTIPAAFSLVLISKMLVYLLVAMSQLVLIFSIGVLVFPSIGLPQLEIPGNIPALVLIAFLSGFSAVSYAVLIGSLAKTQEQANGVGAISIIIFAAIGGIWVPSFVMPDYLQDIGKCSPLHWCLEGFYVLFLQGGAWKELQGAVVFLTAFSVLCQLIVFIQLKIQKYI